MIVKESGDIFVCDCGFSWRRGKSGAHDCADGYRKQIAELRAKLANPVVLPARFKPEVSKVDVFKGSPVMKLDATGGWLNRTGVIVALKDAGFTVKGE